MIIQKAKKNMFSVVSCLILVLLFTWCAMVETASATYKIRIMGDVSYECTTRETSMTKRATREAVDCFIDNIYGTTNHPYLKVVCEGSDYGGWYACNIAYNQGYPVEFYAIDNGRWYGGAMYMGDLSGTWDVKNYGSCGQ